MANKNPADDATERRRLGVSSRGIVLATVTCLMIAVGLASVRYLVIDSPSATLELPVSPDIATLSVPQLIPPAEPTELPPQVLLPYSESETASTQQAELIAPAAGFDGATPRGIAEPIPAEQRTANRREGARYR
ncbi:MAG: hypothetical protein AAGF31_09635 [Planctomycetota bacterium]